MEHNFKKRYGQNFLKDENIIKKIVDSLDVTKDDLIIEIGLGSGALTKYLTKLDAYYLGYEIDIETNKYLEQYKSDKNTIIYDDFLKRDIKDDIKKIKFNRLFIIGNLPYYITTPIIMKIIESNIEVEECVFMVQKEVAERFSAKPKSRDYGSITVLLNYYYKVEYLFTVGRKCFIPSPNVDSAVIKLTNNKETNDIHIKIFNRLVKDAFQFKRKNLKNNLKGYDLENIERVLKENGYSLNNRAEDLPVEVFVNLTK